MDAEEAEVLTRLQDEHSRLQESSSVVSSECSQLKELLASAEERVARLKSKEYQDEVVKRHRSSTLGRLEMALACKAGYDYLEAQLPNKIRNEPDRLCHPPSIAPYISFLSKLERECGGYDVGESKAEEEIEDEEGSADGS